ncbi:YciI family protein [Caulobacter sp. 17J80-11]|uniref:YciI family protein n=1 Tax=Caulobacter sp. 17J80-11 TaxID=2763502 RepID=UPI001653DF2F|nr:YciI family protein [Caulobacter sp. 17J80-11]MBC6982068.1 hypothetical protein [Caulobacter sp. 17J80-11]
MKYLVLTVRRPAFRDDVRDAHYAFLDRLRAAGALVAAGPFTDRSGGAYVLTADSLDAARELALQDPLHLERCSTVTVHEWDAR